LNENLRILFVTPYFVPDYAASSPMYAAMAEDLAHAGNQVTIVTGMPHYGRGQVWEEYKGKFFIDESWRGCRILRVYSYVPNRTSRLSKLISLLCFQAIAAPLCLRLRRHEVAFISNPFLAAWLPLLLLSLVRRTTVIYSVEDVYPDVLARQGALKSPLLTRISEMLERTCYQNARYVRVLSEGMQSLMISKGVPAEKIAIIPFFADTEFIQPLPRQNGFRERFGLDGKFVVLYAGNMGLSHGLNTVIETAALLDDPSVLFLMVGEGTARSLLEERARQLGLSNVRFLPFQPREELPLLLASADVSLVTLQDGMQHECVPSKVYWLLASGRPVIASADPDSEIARLLCEAGCGVLVPPNSPEALASAIRDLRDKQWEAIAMGQRSRHLAVRHYSREVVVQRFRALVESCAPQPV